MMHIVISYSVFIILCLSAVRSDVAVSSPASHISIFGSKLKNENVETVIKDKYSESTIKKLSTPLDLFQSLSSIFIGFVNKHDVKYNIDQIETYILSYLDSVFFSKSTKELFIVYETNSNEPEASINTSISRINEIFNQFLTEFSEEDSRLSYLKSNAKVM